VVAADPADPGPPDPAPQAVDIPAVPERAPKRLDLALARGNGLAAWYRFEDFTGKVLDSSGNGNHGVTEGSYYKRGVPGRYGRAILFMGSNGRVHVPAAPSLDALNAITIEVWVKIADDNEIGTTVSRGTGNRDDTIAQNISCGNIQTIFQRVSSGTTAPTTGCGFLRPGQWTYVAVVNDGTKAHVYINGAAVFSGPGGHLGPLQSDLYIGSRERGAFPLNGVIDEVKWWTVARTQAEVCGDGGGDWNGSSCAF
jgi:hypothetical protein